MPAKAMILLIILLFSIPGFIYLLLATWVARMRIWAARIMLLLAMADMMLLGVIFITAWGGRQAIYICSVAALFVISLGMLSAFLGRGLECRKRLQMPRTLNAPLANGR